MSNMRSYYWYDTSGVVRGRLERGGGWQPGQDPTEASPADPVAAQQKAYVEAQPTFAGWVEFDCDPCPAACEATGYCETVGGCCQLAQFKYVSGGVLTDRINATWEIDITNVGGPTIGPLLYPPGNTVSVRVVAAVPDGIQATLARVPGSAYPVALSDSLPIVLTFNGGKSQAFNLVVPLAGMAGAVWFDQIPMLWSRLILQGSVGA